MEKFNQLAVNIVRKGLSNMDFSMLSPELKKQILTKAGELLFKEGRYLEAVKALSLCDNQKELIEWGDHFLNQNKFELAALCYISSKDEIRLKNIGTILLREGMYTLALEVYEALNEEAMISFIKENF